MARPWALSAGPRLGVGLPARVRVLSDPGPSSPSRGGDGRGPFGQEVGYCKGLRFSHPALTPELESRLGGGNLRHGSEVLHDRSPSHFFSGRGRALGEDSRETSRRIWPLTPTPCMALGNRGPGPPTQATRAALGSFPPQSLGESLGREVKGHRRTLPPPGPRAQVKGVRVRARAAATVPGSRPACAGAAVAPR